DGLDVPRRAADEEPIAEAAGAPLHLRAEAHVASVAQAQRAEGEEGVPRAVGITLRDGDGREPRWAAAGGVAEIEGGAREEARGRRLEGHDPEARERGRGGEELIERAAGDRVRLGGLALQRHRADGSRERPA